MGKNQDCIDHMDLNKILKGVSRSFYLSLVLLPRRIGKPMSLAFLACKAADTIADTDLLPKEKRLQLLDAYREMFATPANGFANDFSPPFDKGGEGGISYEAELLRALPQLMSALNKLPPDDWILIQELVMELTQGMQIDLTLTTLQTEAELEQYTYYVAGCVGRFWTKMLRTHFSFAKNWPTEMEDLGEKLGKGLQLVNILRDLPRDLRGGRCYLPQALLQKVGIQPNDLLDQENFDKVKVALNYFATKAYHNLEAYQDYCRHFPSYALRLKSAVKLPALLGFKTLALLKASPEWLNPDVIIKVPRKEVYQTLLASLV